MVSPEPYGEANKRYSSFHPYISVIVAEIKTDKLVIDSDISDLAKAEYRTAVGGVVLVAPLCATVLAAGTAFPVAFIPGLLCAGEVGTQLTRNTKEIITQKEHGIVQLMSENLAMSSKGFSNELQNALVSYARESGIQNVESGLLSKYPAGAQIIQVEATKISFKKHAEFPGSPYSFSLTVSAKMIDGSTGSELNSLNYKYQGGVAPLEKWTENGHAYFQKVAMDAYHDIASIIFDDFLLIWQPRLPKDWKGTEATRWSSSTHRSCFLKGQTPDSDRFNRVKTLTPSFAWEAFPRPDDIDGVLLQAGDITDVRYELRIYRRNQIEINTLLPNGDLVYRRTNLAAPYHMVDELLDFCTKYFWTVRAKFLLKGQPRVTEWAGRYDHNIHNIFLPWDMRRNTDIPKVGLDSYYLLNTPEAPWSGKCTSYR